VLGFELLFPYTAVQKRFSKKKGRVPKKNNAHTFENRKILLKQEVKRWLIIPLMQ